MQKKLVKYIIGTPEVVLTFCFEKTTAQITGFSDSDWAGCKETMKSTSGGLIMLGSHLVKSWSVQQKNITLSSAEAELVAMEKVTAESLGVRSLCNEWGMCKSVMICADASAALAIVRRSGAGRVRHIDVGLLWLQDVNKNCLVKFGKIDGQNNPADWLTKPITQDKAGLYSEIVSTIAISGSKRVVQNVLTSNRMEGPSRPVWRLGNSEEQEQFAWQVERPPWRTSRSTTRSRGTPSASASSWAWRKDEEAAKEEVYLDQRGDKWVKMQEEPKGKEGDKEKGKGKQ